MPKCGMFLLIGFLLSGVGGCKGIPGQGGGPPSPLEVQSLTAISVGLAVSDMDAEKLAKMHSILTAAQSSMNLALNNDPTTVEAVNLEFVEGLDPVYQDIVGNLLNILVLRIKPYIDTENPDLELARGYVDAVFTGALQSISIAQRRQA